MAKEGIYDLVVDEIRNRHQLVRAELQERFKRTKPFREEEESYKERVMDYDEFLKNEPMLRQNFGSEAVDNYKMKLESKLRR
jgi:hypothetical protein